MDKQSEFNRSLEKLAIQASLLAANTKITGMEAKRFLLQSASLSFQLFFPKVADSKGAIDAILNTTMDDMLVYEAKEVAKKVLEEAIQRGVFRG